MTTPPDLKSAQDQGFVEQVLVVAAGTTIGFTVAGIILAVLGVF